MRLEQMRYLDAIVRLRSFRKAAEELDLAEPSLSQQIRKLESELGGQLVERRRQAVKLTDFGAAIMPHALALLSDEARIRQEADDYHGLRRGHLRFGTVNAGSNTLLPLVLPLFSGRYPGIEVRVTETGSLDITERIVAGELDLGLIARAPDVASLPEGLTAEDLLSSTLVICVPAGHRLSRRRSVSTAELAREPLIIFRQGYLLHEVLRTMLGDRIGNVVYYTDNTESAKRMVALGVGVTLLPELSVVDDSYRREGKIVYLRPQADFPRILLSLVSRTDTYLPRAARAFRDMLREAASTHAAARSSA
jgi:DNA-binding transcriptional LysR family regulator